MNRIEETRGTLHAGRTCSTALRLVAMGLVLALAVAAPAAATAILKTWQPNAADGTHPQYELVADGGGYLYGTTPSGGAMNLGVVFRVKTDGTDYQLLHTFEGGASDGASPLGGLVLDGLGNIYGTTYMGGSADLGTFFKITTTGTGFTVLHGFTGAPGPTADGANPMGTLAYDGVGTFYGTTEGGGEFGWGTVFMVDTSGTTFKVLHSFGDPAIVDGYVPEGGVILSGGYLYGTTYGTSDPAGLIADYGTVFKLTTGGGNYELLHIFADDGLDGAFPYGALVIAGSGDLYGTAYKGGANDSGTVFTLTTAGLNFKVLHDFGAEASDGLNPYSALIADGGTLYGTTISGGGSGFGTVFKIEVGGDQYGVVYSLLGLPLDGRNPYASPLLIGTTLYGTAGRGGATECGAIFKVDTNGSNRGLVHSFIGAPEEGSDPRAALLFDETSGWLYGTTYSGGGHDFGVLFRIKFEGWDYQPMHDFLGGASDGSFPQAAVISDGAGNLYGTTYAGGQYNRGTVFTITKNGFGYKVLHHFSDAADNGSRPFAPLLLDGGILYGTTSQGGASGLGTVFKLQTDGNGFALLHSFAGPDSGDGSAPRSGLVLDGDGFLYSTTYAGGDLPDPTTTRGTVFKIGMNGTDYSILHTFTTGPSEGMNPQAGLVLDGEGNLYGTTNRGGAGSNVGTVFTLTTTGGGFKLLHDFDGEPADGAYPEASLIFDGEGNLYGTTFTGGAWNLGSIYTLKTTGDAFTLLHSFAGGADDGAMPYAGVIRDSRGNLYGTTEAGGEWNQGTVYSPSHLLVILMSGSGQGTVTSDPPGIDYGVIPVARFQPDTPVTLTAVAAVSSTFDGWSGADCPDTGTCEVLMDRDREIAATFSEIYYTLTVRKEGSGTGTVSSPFPPFYCGDTCSVDYPYGWFITLTAAPDANSSFDGWSGEGCSGTGTCTVEMTAARNVTATFKLGVPSSERLALTTFFTSTGGVNWSLNTGWKTPPLEVDGFAAYGTECTWVGIGCDSSNHVMSINLPNRNLTGLLSDLSALTHLLTLKLLNNRGLTPAPVPGWLAGMNSLVTLSLNRTSRTGAIPDLSGLPALAYLDLNTNPFDAGPIPAWMATKTSLIQLLIGGTNRTGTIPDFSGLTNLTTLSLGPAPAMDAAPIPAWIPGMTQLQVLNLPNTNRTGDIPDLSGMIALTTLNVGTNLRMRGQIPTWLATMTTLVNLTLANTRRTGTIPNLSTLVNLAALDLSNNWTLDPAPLPAWIGSLTSLQILYLQYTNLSGALPDLHDLVNLAALNLSNNPMLDAAPVPAWLTGLTNLQELYLTNTNRSGTIPDLSGMWPLVVLDLSGNPGLEAAPIPAWLVAGPNLGEVYLRNTNRTGAIPDLHASEVLYWLDFSDNPNVTVGPLPAPGTLPPQLNGLYLANTSRTSIATDLSPLGGLQAIDFSRNPIPPGPVPSWILGDVALNEVSLAGDGITGAFPDFSGLAGLYYLDLHENPDLDAGTIPGWLLDMDMLQYVLIGNTNRTGDITDLSAMANLLYLDLANSPTLTPGPVPTWVATKTTLQVLALTGTNRTGDIPDLSGLTSLTQLYLDENPGFTAGGVPSWPASMPALVFLQLTNTNRTGAVPSWPGPSNLKGLWLGHNHLLGDIPPELGDSIVRYLQLQGNMLNGNVPASFANLIQLWPPIYDPNCSDLRWNALHVYDPELDAFLDSRQIGGDWSSTQTIAPTNVSHGTPGSTSVPISWTPIPYSSDSGGYRVGYSKTQGGPYTTFGTMTVDKTTGTLTVTGLDPNTPYWFMVQTRTDPHANNPNWVDSDLSEEITATTAPLITLTVTKSGTGLGSVTSDPAGIDCGATCSYDFPYPTPVTLTAVADPGSQFTGWSGEGCTGTGTCQVTMDQARSVDATFTAGAKFYPLTPCRVVDTRSSIDPSAVKRGNFLDDEVRAYTLSQSTDCPGLPTDAKAWSLNIQFRPMTVAAYLIAFPDGITQPPVSTLVASPSRWRVNNAIVPAGSGGTFDVYCQYAGRVVIDVNGYFK